MEKKIVFDTNYLLSNSKEISTTIEKLNEEGYSTYIARICIDELRWQRKRDAIEKDKILKKAQLNALYSNYFISNVELCLDQSFEKIDKEIDNLIETNYGSHIIEYQDKNKYFDTILKRVNFKKPPFSNEENSSDKGFKDSILWICLLEHSLLKKDCHYTLVTKDDAFRKYANELEFEFKLETGNEISILSSSDSVQLFRTLEIQKIRIENPIVEIDKQVKLENSPLSQEYVIEINDDIEKIAYTNVEDFNSFEDYYAKNFVIYSKIDSVKVLEILNYLEDQISKKYSLHLKFNFSSIMIMFGINCTNKYDVNRSVILKLLAHFSKLKKEHPISLDAFLELLTEKINETFVHIDIDMQDLPF